MTHAKEYRELPDTFLRSSGLAERVMRRLMTMKDAKWSRKRCDVSFTMPPQINDPAGILRTLHSLRSGPGMRHSVPR